jgi:cytochrome c-type biogenesis protein CcmH/NrfG
MSRRTRKVQFDRIAPLSRLRRRRRTDLAPSAGQDTMSRTAAIVRVESGAAVRSAARVAHIARAEGNHSMKKLPAKQTGWTSVQVYTAIVVVLIVGGVGGYLLHSSGTPAESSARDSAPPSSAGTSLPPSSLATAPSQIIEAETKPLLARLDANPKDVAALTELGNIYFDASQWPAAIGYYTRALNENPRNPDVRTDMGIAYYYTGDADRALHEFDQALKDDPRHVQTLFNVGVVKMGGKNDPKGAIAAWESLLKIEPAFKDRLKVESLLTEARAKLR